MKVQCSQSECELKLMVGTAGASNGWGSDGAADVDGSEEEVNICTDVIYAVITSDWRDKRTR
jgi:hypothetical protein